MTDLEKSLANALNRLIFSADHYVEDGTWIDVLDMDIKNARQMIAEYKSIKSGSSHLTSE